MLLKLRLVIYWANNSCNWVWFICISVSCVARIQIDLSVWLHLARAWTDGVLTLTLHNRSRVVFSCLAKGESDADTIFGRGCTTSAYLSCSCCDRYCCYIYKVTYKFSANFYLISSYVLKSSECQKISWNHHETRRFIDVLKGY